MILTCHIPSMLTFHFLLNITLHITCNHHAFKTQKIHACFIKSIVQVNSSVRCMWTIKKLIVLITEKLVTIKQHYTTLTLQKKPNFCERLQNSYKNKRKSRHFQDSISTIYIEYVLLAYQIS